MEFICQANKNKTDKFYVDLENNPMSEKQLWRSNKQFLRKHMWKGSVFELSSKVNPEWGHRGFNKEIKFMNRNGYKVSSDGKKLLYGN